MDILMIVKAFAVGGALCIIAQLLIDYTKLTPARILSLFVVVGVMLTAVGLYGPLIKFASAGASVPLTGFGYTLAKGVEKAVSQHGILGILQGGITATAGGITAAILFGFISSLLCKSSDKS